MWCFDDLPGSTLRHRSSTQTLSSDTRGSTDVVDLPRKQRYDVALTSKYKRDTITQYTVCPSVHSARAQLPSLGSHEARPHATQGSLRCAAACCTAVYLGPHILAVAVVGAAAVAAHVHFSLCSSTNSTSAFSAAGNTLSP
jgi:hypothetical protein